MKRKQAKSGRETVRKNDMKKVGLRGKKLTNTLEILRFVHFIGENNPDKLNDSGEEKIGFEGNAFEAPVL